MTDAEFMEALAMYLVLSRRIDQGLELLPKELGKKGGRFIEKRVALDGLAKLRDEYFARIEEALVKRGYPI